MARKRSATGGGVSTAADIHAVSGKTNRKVLFWLRGKREELDVLGIPTRHLYFNIENGRYADKMIQLRADNPGVEIDPRNPEWRKKIHEMLKGEYPGTEKDREPFGTLRSDILAKQQLQPGVVLSDGGVLDGNRRLAVLLDLEAAEKNPTRFEYFEGAILPLDVDAEDRWRIEAGLQIGRDEKLAYSPINELLKIKEGLKLFRPPKTPESEIAKTLYGISESEVKKDIQKIRLIDEYLAFIGRPEAYQLVGDVIERFEEALTTLEAAKKIQMPPAEVQKLKHTLFAFIHDKTMTNWEMRDIRSAMGAPGRGKSAKLKNKTALSQLLETGSDSKKLRQSLTKSKGGKPSDLVQEHKLKAGAFLDRMEATKVATEPLRLAERAKTNLETLHSGVCPKSS